MIITLSITAIVMLITIILYKCYYGNLEDAYVLVTGRRLVKTDD